MRAFWFIPVLLTLATATQADVLSEREQAAARKLSLTKCAKCHQFYSPTRYTETVWRDWMARMNRKAMVKPEQEELLSRYFATLRAESRASSTNVSARR